VVRTPILLYHSVSEESSAAIAPFTVTPAVFAEHLDAIVESGRRAVTASEYAAALTRGEVPQRAVVITFDDGYADFRRCALPELTRRALPSTLYVTSGFLEGSPDSRTRVRPPDRMLQWAELSELASAGVEIGGHSHSHFQLDTLGRSRAHDEITRCKELLQEAIAAEVVSFAYPHGYSSRAVRSLTRAAGYRSAVSVKNAFSTGSDDVFSLARLTVKSTTGQAQVRDWLDGVGARTGPPGERVATRLWRTYRRSRSLVTGRPGCAFG